MEITQPVIIRHDQCTLDLSSVVAAKQLTATLPHSTTVYFSNLRAVDCLLLEV